MMGNHIHLVAAPGRADSLARALGRTHADYARYWNTRRTSCGHVWQARFYSCPLAEEHVWTVVRYVEMNPVRAGLVDRADCWRWSSALAHLTGRDRSGILDMSVWAAEYDGPGWRRVLETSVNDEAWRQRVKEATLTGRPLGSEAFIDRLESALGCELRPRPRGRPARQINGE